MTQHNQEVNRGYGVCFYNYPGSDEIVVKTNCYECDSQVGCDRTALWTRLGTALKNLRPEIKVYDNEWEIQNHVSDTSYPRILTRQHGANAGSTYSSQLCASVVFQATKAQEYSERHSDWLYRMGGIRHFLYSFFTLKLPGHIPFTEGTPNVLQLQKQDVSKNDYDLINYKIAMNSTSSSNTNYGFNFKEFTSPRHQQHYSLPFMISGFSGLQTVVNDFLNSP